MYKTIPLQASWLQGMFSSKADPTAQSAPPFEGGGFVQVRVLKMLFN